MRTSPERRSLSRQDVAGKTLAYVLLITVTILIAGPLVWMLSSSLRHLDQMMTIPIRWFTWPLVWGNYPRALTEIPFFRELANTLFLSIATSVGATISASMAAYALSRLQWPGRQGVFLLLIGTMFLPGAVTLIPTYLIFRDLGWVGTYLPLIVPSFLAPAFATFLLRQFFLTIPTSLNDAGRVDGASEWTIFSRILMPVTVPAIGTVAVLTFVATWTDYLNPLIYISSPQQYTLSLGLSAFLGQHSANWNLLMAAGVVFTLPLIVLFFFGQRFFLRGLVLSGDQ